MSHTHMITDDAGGEWTAIANGDFSGKVEFFTLSANVNSESSYDERHTRFTIPFEVLAEIVGQKMQADAIARLEQLSGREYVNERRPD